MLNKLINTSFYLTVLASWIIAELIMYTCYLLSNNSWILAIMVCLTLADMLVVFGYKYTNRKMMGGII